MSREVVPIPLAPALLKRLERELTDTLMTRVTSYARSRIPMKRRVGVACFDNSADEAEVMAQDAITLTILGHRVWNPDVDLFTHLCGVIRSESTREKRNAEKRGHHLPVDAMRLDESYDGKLIKDHAEMSNRAGSDATARPRRVASIADAARRFLAELRPHAHRDPHVRMLLDAYESGCKSRKDVLAMTDLSPDEYRNARRKLDRMIQNLPTTFNEGVLDALEYTHDHAQ